MRRSPPKDQQGFLVITVVLVLAILAAMALMISSSASLDNALVAKHADSAALEYVTKAGMDHAQWQLAQNTSCTNYANLPSTPFGVHSYAAKFSPTSGSPVALSAVGTLADGASQTLTRSSVKTYEPGTTLVLQPDAAAGKDTYVYQWKSAWNYGTSTALRVANSTAGDWSNALLEFDLSSIPAAARIISATLVLNQSSPAASGGDFSVHRVTSPWVEGVKAGGNGSPNWTDRDTGVAWTTPGGDYDSAPVATISFSAGLAPHQWEVAALVRNWVSGESANYGMVIVPASFGSDAFFHSSDASNAALRPALEVTYACECGIGGASGSTTLQPGVLGKEAMLRTNNNYGATPYTWIDTSVPYHSLYEFDLSGLPPGAVVTSALLDIHQSSADLVSVAANLDVHRAKTAWIEGTGGTSGISPPDGATWETSDGTTSWITVGGDYDAAVIDSVVVNSTGTAWHQWDVTSLAQSWADGTYPNFGFLLRASSGDLTKLYLDTGEDNDVTVHPKLSISFDCPCGTICEVSSGSSPGAGTSLLFVVGDPANLTTQQQNKKTLIEGWGHSVTLIATSESQAAFDTAAALVDVVYIPELGTTPMNELGTKADDLAVGVITEESRRAIKLGSFQLLPFVSTTSINIVDNTHFITETLPTGNAVLSTATQSFWKLGGTLAPDLHVLGDLTGSVPGLAYVDVGETVNDGNPAPGRRVKLPWGANDFDVTLLTNDARTIMQRAIEWGATAPLQAGYYLDEFNSLTCDPASDYTGSDGTLDWSGFQWQETLDDAAPCSGEINVVVGGGSNRLKLRGDGKGIERRVDLSAFSVATLSFNYLQEGPFDATRYLSIWASADSGGNWAEVGRIDAPGDGTYQTASYDISAYVGSDAMLRFEATDLSSTREIFVDNIRIDDVPVGGSGSGSGLYVETDQVWTGSLSDQWQVQDLSGFGVPPNAVVEVAIENDHKSGEFEGGVRAVGSGFARMFDLHKAEAGGVNAIALQVQTDGNSSVEHFTGSAGFVTFRLLGYWTGAAYVEYEGFFSAGASGSWQTHSLAPYGAAPGQIVEIVMQNIDGANEHQTGVRKAGSGIQRLVDLHEAEDGGKDHHSVFVETSSDASASVEVYAEDAGTIEFRLLGAWSTPPGTYQEALVDLGSATADKTWQTVDLSGHGVPPNAVVQITLANLATAVQNDQGVRATNSSLDRTIDLHEAEDGGQDLVTMHVLADAGSQIQWYHEDVSDTHRFYLMGWWD